MQRCRRPLIITHFYLKTKSILIINFIKKGDKSLYLLHFHFVYIYCLIRLFSDERFVVKIMRDKTNFMVKFDNSSNHIPQ